MGKDLSSKTIRRSWQKYQSQGPIHPMAAVGTTRTRMPAMKHDSVDSAGSPWCIARPAGFVEDCEALRMQEQEGSSEMFIMTDCKFNAVRSTGSLTE